MVVEEDVCNLNGGVLVVEYRFDFHHAVFRGAQVSYDDPAFEVHCGQQERVCLLRHVRRGNLFFVVIDHLL